MEDSGKKTTFAPYDFGRFPQEISSQKVGGLYPHPTRATCVW